MKTKHVLILSMLLVFHSALAQKQELLPYLTFLERQKVSSVDYILGLFDKYDIVVLGERDHRDTTQYELIEKVMADPRFIEKVGNVCTEVGTCNRTGWVNRVLKGTYACEAQFEDSLRALYREADTEILWRAYTYWQYLKSIYHINKNLPAGKKITAYLLDRAYDWRQCTTPEQRKKEWDAYYGGGIRDSIMGGNFIRFFDQIRADKEQPRKKALVILNTYHSFRSYQTFHPYWLNPAAHYIFQAYPGRVANVMINRWDFRNEGRKRLMEGGKWDAAFQYYGNPSVGFDLENSPFGNDLFDLYDKPMNPLSYKDIYHGFVFYKPINEWVMQLGIPGIIDDGFKPELIRRELLIFPENASKIKAPDYLRERIGHYNDVRTVDTYTDKTPREEIDKCIKEWLE